MTGTDCDPFDPFNSGVGDSLLAGSVAAAATALRAITCAAAAARHKLHPLPAFTRGMPKE